MEKSDNTPESLSQADASARTQTQGNEPTGLRKFFQRNGLRIAGGLNLIGDAFLLASGIKNKDPYRIAGGGLYTIGALNILIYGKTNREWNMRDMSERMGEFMVHHGAHLEPGSELSHIQHTKRTGVIADINRYLHHNPAQTMTGLYSVGAAAMLGSGVREYQQKGRIGTLGYATSSLGFKAASFAIPEHPQDDNISDDKSNKTPMQKLTRWVKEKPLRVFGYGSFITDSLMGYSAYENFKNDPLKRRDYLTEITSLSYLAADLLVANSHKDPSNGDGKFTKNELHRMEDMAAQTIVGQSKTQQDTLINSTSAFLARQSSIKESSDNIKRDIIERVKQAKGDKWVDRSTDTAETDLVQPQR